MTSPDGDPSATPDPGGGSPHYSQLTLRPSPHRRRHGLLKNVTFRSELSPEQRVNQ